MTLKVIGSGTAFATIQQGNSNFLLEEDGKFILLDCGTTCTYILRDEWGFDLGDLDSIYISHNHADHCTIEQLAFHRYFIPTKSGETIRPKLYAAAALMPILWNESLKGGLDCLHGRVATLTTYFDCCPVQKNKGFTWQGIKFNLVQTTHVNSGYQIKHCYGLFIENPKNGLKTFITGDSIWNPDGFDFLYKSADCIYQDTETGPRSRVHANWEDIRTLPDEIRSKMFHYHYSKIPDDADPARFIKKGQVFEI